MIWWGYPLTICLAIAVVALCNLVHFYALRRMASHFGDETCDTKRPMLWITGIIFVVHLFEVGLYAGVIWILTVLELGGMGGALADESRWLLTDLYLSISSYTTLGIGDIVPEGALRLFVGIEALHGLILIAWSASFTYLMMERLWKFGSGVQPATDYQAGISSDRSE
ncbi:ion channel [Qipengyuania atrilutea]|uniref:Two pore domain potassium channel family protein n=1 Tax=Qipengyuania atrilutea TaxID=2744473 RepID=A0A850H6A3_9SPHN|nr:ion channel [Actirhodobacter atriluteus]NVD45378.1 two pore domain potassium channel family protein [Actirhodobacter atriluteus]